MEERKERKDGEGKGRGWEGGRKKGVERKRRREI